MSREGAEAYEHKLSQIVDISRHTNTKQTDTRAARVVTSAARAILVAKKRSSEKKRKKCIFGLVCSRARASGAALDDTHAKNADENASRSSASSAFSFCFCFPREKHLGGRCCALFTCPEKK